MSRRSQHTRYAAAEHGIRTVQVLSAGELTFETAKHEAEQAQSAMHRRAWAVRMATKLAAEEVLNERERKSPEAIQLLADVPVWKFSKRRPVEHVMLKDGKVHCRHCRVQWIDDQGEHRGFPCQTYKCEPCSTRKKQRIVREVRDGYGRRWGTMPAMLVTLTYRCKPKALSWQQYQDYEEFDSEVWRRSLWYPHEWRSQITRDLDRLRKRFQRKFKQSMEFFRVYQDTKQTSQTGTGWPHIHFAMPETIDRKVFLHWLRVQWTELAPGTTYWHGAFIRDSRSYATQAIKYCARYIVTNYSSITNRRHQRTRGWPKAIYAGEDRFWDDQHTNYNLHERRRAYAAWYRKVKLSRPVSIDLDTGEIMPARGRWTYQPAPTSLWGIMQAMDGRHRLTVEVDQDYNPVASAGSAQWRYAEWSDNSLERTFA